MRPRHSWTATAVCVAVLLSTPALAGAANDLEVGIADENVLTGGTPGGTDVTVERWKASGVQDVRIFAQWDKLVPQDTKTEAKMPAGFRPGDPASYDLAQLDAKIDAVVRHGLNVTLVVTGAGPAWGSSEPARPCPWCRCSVARRITLLTKVQEPSPWKAKS
ncbi:hypothetical protein AB0L40_04925 [Patulibacter sp. NPDC049589]|uniref:hypothetical protein n=1 Tax=Patulibacter sp. NPDC049589 TaxID=3154731 RepID=UPI00342CBC2B